MNIDDKLKGAELDANHRIIENFLGSMDMNISEADQMRNWLYDSLSYGWNHKINNAIRAGIEQAYNLKLNKSIGGDNEFSREVH